jgi:hypothetical protein
MENSGSAQQVRIARLYAFARVLVSLVLGNLSKAKIFAMRLAIAPYVGLRYALAIDAEDVVVLFLVFILGGATLPTAFSQWFNSSTAGWPTATATIYMLGPLFGVIAMITLLIARHRKK